MAINLLATYVEVWPVAADERGLYLVSGPDAWRVGPLMSDTTPWDEMDLLLASHGAFVASEEHPDGEVVIQHGTSTRPFGQGRRIETYVAVLDGAGDVLDRWPDAVPISELVLEQAGPPATHASTTIAEVRPIDPLLHALRALGHLRYLDEWDATARRDLPPLVRDGIQSIRAILTSLYRTEHPGQAPAARSRAA